MSRMTTLQKKSRSQARRANRRASKAVSPVAADARDTAARYAGSTRDWAAPKVETAVDWASPKVDTAVEWAAPKVGSARDWVAPKVEPAVGKVKSDVIPAVAGAVATALAASEPARAEAAHRGSAAFAALKGEVDPPRKGSHRVRKLFMLATVLGAAFAGWKAWAARSEDPVDAWTTPAPRPDVPPVSPASASAATVTATGMGTDDPAGAGPDEVIADAAKEDEVDDVTVVEPVTPEQSDKVARAAAKGNGSAAG